MGSMRRDHLPCAFCWPRAGGVVRHAARLGFLRKGLGAMPRRRESISTNLFTCGECRASCTRSFFLLSTVLFACRKCGVSWVGGGVSCGEGTASCGEGGVLWAKNCVAAEGAGLDAHPRGEHLGGWDFGPRIEGAHVPIEGFLPRDKGEQGAGSRGHL